jgi:hypothetical protein
MPDIACIAILVLRVFATRWAEHQILKCSNQVKQSIKKAIKSKQFPVNLCRVCVKDGFSGKKNGPACAGPLNCDLLCRKT